ncbi:MAG: hypothetical protein ACXVCV_17815, partial [Polyangia bacterium]
MLLTARRMRIQFLVPILLLSACTDGASPSSPSTSGTSAAASVDASALPAELRDRALGHIALHFE